MRTIQASLRFAGSCKQAFGAYGFEGILAVQQRKLTPFSYVLLHALRMFGLRVRR